VIRGEWRRSERPRRAWLRPGCLVGLALAGPAGVATAPAHAQGTPAAVTPSPLNAEAGPSPKVVERIPLPPLPGQVVPANPVPATAAPAPIPPALAGPDGLEARARVIDLRPDTTGFVPERPPGPPEPPPRAAAARQVEELIEVANTATAEIAVVVGRTRLIQTREPLTRIAVANPAIADVELINDRPNSRLINLYGRAFGTTDLTLWDANNRPTTFLVRVTLDTRDLEARLRQIFPGADVRIRQVGQQVILEGQVPNAKTMADVLQLVTSELRGGQSSGAGGAVGGGGGGLPAGGGAAGGAPPGGGGAAPGGGGAPGGAGAASAIINRVRVPGPRQIMLRVKIAELNRTAIREIGVNWLDTRNNAILGSQIGNVGALTASGGVAQSASFTPGSLVPRPTVANPNAYGLLPNIAKPISSSFNAAASAAPTGSSQLFGIFNAGEFSLFLNALRQNSLAKVLAEPNLVTLDGQPARFLAGGRFPYPVPQNNTGNGSIITIEFARFGAILNFLPHILENDLIRLDVEPNFSELNFASGTAVNGTTVPGITERSARTVVEMREGQTLAIAGLLQTVTSASTARVPGLGDLPIVGQLFSRNQISTVETELVVLVTPELVAPMEACEVPEQPGDRVIQPNDYEFFFLGRIEGKTGKDFRATIRHHDPLDVMKHFQSDARHVVGPHGYVD